MLLHTLRVPAARMCGLAWDARGEHLALATGLYNPGPPATVTSLGPGRPAPAPAGQLLLATVRCAHAWAYLGAGACSGAGTAARCGVAGAGETLVYAYRSAAGAGTCVAFWDTRSGERRVKNVRRLLAIAVSAQHAFGGRLQGQHPAIPMNQSEFHGFVQKKVGMS